MSPGSLLRLVVDEGMYANVVALFPRMTGDGCVSFPCHQGQCYDIHSVSGSEVSGLDDVENICEIGNQEIFG